MKGLGMKDIKTISVTSGYERITFKGPRTLSMQKSPTEIFSPFLRESLRIPRPTYIQAYFWVYQKVAFKKLTPELMKYMDEEYSRLSQLLEDQQVVDDIFSYYILQKNKLKNSKG